MSLPTDPKARKDAPIYSGVIMYFPDAIAEVAHTSATCDPPLNALASLLPRAGGRDERGERVSAVIARYALIALERELDPGFEWRPVPAGVHSAVLAAFPRALTAIAELSRVGNEQHNPGKPMHWDRSKSGDELDALTRHLVEAGTHDTDGVRHTAKVAWRALANLQKEIERDAAARAENEARVSLANRPRVDDVRDPRHRSPCGCTRSCDCGS